MTVGGSKCALADKDCAGRLEWHHAVKQQRLKRVFPFGAVWSSLDQRYLAVNRHFPVLMSGHGQITLDEILGDPRNRVWACSLHHEKITNARVDVELPESVWEFARDFGLTAMLENDLARRRAA